MADIPLWLLAVWPKWDTGACIWNFFELLSYMNCSSLEAHSIVLQTTIVRENLWHKINESTSFCDCSFNKKNSHSFKDLQLIFYIIYLLFVANYLDNWKSIAVLKGDGSRPEGDRSVNAASVMSAATGANGSHLRYYKDYKLTPVTSASHVAWHWPLQSVGTALRVSLGGITKTINWHQWRVRHMSLGTDLCSRLGLLYECH